MIERLAVWVRNAFHFHHRVMARFLKNREWVVFHLEPEHRTCDENCCWLKLYQYEESKNV